MDKTTVFFLTALAKLSDERWSDDACLGYLLMTLKALQYDEPDICKVISAAKAIISDTPIEKAAFYYKKAAFNISPDSER